MKVSTAATAVPARVTRATQRIVTPTRGRELRALAGLMQCVVSADAAASGVARRRRARAPGAAARVGVSLTRHGT